MVDQIKLDSETGRIKSFIQQRRKKWILSHCATHILTNSQENKAELSTLYKIPPSCVHVFHYLIPDYFRSGTLPDIRDRAGKMTFVARLDKSKGHANVVSEMPLLLATLPALKLYIIGEGKEKENLESLCRELGIIDNVVFTGAVNLPEVYSYLSKSLLHISASEQEAFGLVNAEALSAGTPILANAVGGINEILDDRLNGLFYDPHKRGDFTAKVLALLDDDWQTYSRQARHSFLHKFSSTDANLSAQLSRLNCLLKTQV
jgi:glycosyltransferase involved in cell wall biosynthesis